MLAGSYTALKECIAISEHKRMFPSSGGKPGCQTLYPGTEFEVSYCLCNDGDYCNGQPLSMQMSGAVDGTVVRDALCMCKLHRSPSGAIPTRLASATTAGRRTCERLCRVA